MTKQKSLRHRVCIIPFFIKGFILVGITVCLLSITLAIYSFLKKKQTLKEIGSYMLYTFGGGTIVSLFGLLVNFTANFNIDFISYRYTIPLAYIISLLTTPTGLPVGFLLSSLACNRASFSDFGIQV